MPIIIPDNLPYTPRGIECLRLGARRGGEGIGCCAMDVIQGFNNAPDAIRPQAPFFDGDGWYPVMYEDGENQLCVGGEGITNEQAFLAYLTHGSFTPEPEPDHAFVAVLSGSQVNSYNGKAWMRILKREGFQWVGCSSNSVYSEKHPNHIFLLVRNTTNHMTEEEVESLKAPPKSWLEIEEPSQSPAERFVELCETYAAAHTPATEKTAEILRLSQNVG